MEENQSFSGPSPGPALASPPGTFGALVEVAVLEEAAHTVVGEEPFVDSTLVAVGMHRIAEE